MCDEETVNEQNVWEFYKKVEAENYHLKNQLSRKNREIKRLKRIISVWKKKYEKVTENNKPKYKNNKRRN